MSELDLCVLHPHRKRPDVVRLNDDADRGHCQGRAKGETADGDQLPVGDGDSDGDEDAERREEHEMLPLRACVVNRN